MIAKQLNQSDLMLCSKLHIPVKAMSEYGNLSRLLAADDRMHCNESQNQYLNSLRELAELYGKQTTNNDITVTGANDVYNIMFRYFISELREKFYGVILDSALHIKHIIMIAVGTNDKIEQIYVRDIIREVIKVGCSKLIVVHNHPSGNPDPSESDIEVTKYLNKCMKLMDMELIDHVIIGEGKHHSMKERGEF